MATGLLDKLEGLVDHREVFEAKEVHLQQTHRLDVFHEVLRDHLAVVIALKRDQFVEGISGNHHARSMNAECFVGSFDAHGHVDPALHDGILLVALLEVGIRRLIADHGFEFGGLAPDHRDQLGQTVRISVGNIEHAGHILQHGLRGHAVERDDLSHLFIAVAARDVIDHLAPALNAEVGVDIRHRLAFRIEKTLEQQTVAHGINVGDPKGVGHQ